MCVCVCVCVCVCFVLYFNKDSPRTKPKRPLSNNAL